MNESSAKALLLPVGVAIVLDAQQHRSSRLIASLESIRISKSLTMPQNTISQASRSNLVSSSTKVLLYIRLTGAGKRNRYRSFLALKTV